MQQTGVMPIKKRRGTEECDAFAIEDLDSSLPADLHGARAIGFQRGLAQTHCVLGLFSTDTGRHCHARDPRDCRSAGYVVGMDSLTTLVFADLWMDTEHVFYYIPFVPFVVLPGTLLGLGLGCLIGRLMERKSRSIGNRNSAV